jgi:hypothetical protein
MTERIATGVFFCVLGALICVLGVVTIFPTAIQDGSELCHVEFSLKLIWPSFLVIAFIVAYLNMLGRNFFWS